MMTLYCEHEPENLINSAQHFFDRRVEPEWFEDPMVKQMVEEIDHTEVVSAYHLISPVLGNISYGHLSGGVKGLILLLKEPEYRSYRSTIWGANCVKWIAKLSEVADFNIFMSHPLEFITGADTGKFPICAQAEDGTMLTTCGEVFNYYADHS